MLFEEMTLEIYGGVPPSYLITAMLSFDLTKDKEINDFDLTDDNLELTGRPDGKATSRIYTPATAYRAQTLHGCRGSTN